MPKIKKVTRDLNYSQKLSRMIDEEILGMSTASTFNRYPDSASQPASQLTLSLIGAHSPIEAANIAIKYNGNDPQKAIEVVQGLRDTVNLAQQGFFDGVIKVLRELSNTKSP